ncbi:MAG TPA: SusC/RagA family TonB-linked outer membrane protein, partial [Balneolales bacterium]|nr:SusC/RagA family TonB-linked outer membrane protein [Balneolales bacterium]
MKKLLRLIPVTICALFLVGSAYGQQLKVTGHVKDATSGDPLPGVDILVVGTTIGTTTGSNGEYTINVKSSTDTLRFSYIGYTSKNVPVRGRTTINVELQPKVFKSNQLVVVGYGTQKRSDLTGAISSVSSKSLQQETISTPDQALQGKVAGVMVHTNSHAPGGSITVQVRGTSSISANGQPLYVIDGMPISNDYFTGGEGTGGGGGAPNPLNSIDPSDIASIQVLKGPSAAAIYGSRAVNGVVLITTKEGQRGAQHVNFESSFGIQHIKKYLPLMNAQQWAKQLNEAASQFGEGQAFSSQKISAMGSGTNWQKQLYRTAPTDKYKLSFSGGTNNLQYLVSGVYLNQEGIVRGTNFKRYSTNINIHANVNKNLTIGDNLMFTASTNNLNSSSYKGYGTQPDIIKEALIAPPNVTPYDSAGNPTLYSTYPLGLAGPKNELE